MLRCRSPVRYADDVLSPRSTDVPQIAIAFGGNRGDVRRSVHTALESLEQRAPARISRLSRFYQSDPIGRAVAPFLNGVAIVETQLAPQRLLALCQELEREAGRKPGARWDDRPLDLDLILCGDNVIESQLLTVPHPLMHVRRFVLDPLVEIWPDAIHPIFGRSIRAIHSHWTRRPLRVAIRPFLSCAQEGEPMFSDTIAASIPRSVHSQIDIVESDADFTLSFADVDSTIWPPELELNQWPIPASDAISAALDGVLASPLIA